jgi:hypothetical protein
MLSLKVSFYSGVLALITPNGSLCKNYSYDFKDNKKRFAVKAYRAERFLRKIMFSFSTFMKFKMSILLSAKDGPLSSFFIFLMNFLVPGMFRIRRYWPLGFRSINFLLPTKGYLKIPMFISRRK